MSLVRAEEGRTAENNPCLLYPSGYNYLMPKMVNTLNEYTDEHGNSPYAEWLQLLRDAKARARIIMQVDRMELGLFGDAQPIGDGLSELRIHYGPGDKSTQAKRHQTCQSVLARS